MVDGVANIEYSKNYGDFRFSANNTFYGAPLQGQMYVTDGWGDLQKRHHNGLDIVRKKAGAVNGATIYSPVSGRVVKAIDYEDRGGVRVRIKDANGDEHALYHMQVGSNSHVLALRTVSKGDILGRVGNTGGSQGPHLHYEVWRNGNRKDRPNPGTINPTVLNLPKR